ncbi:MAG TPA: hypothetical protein VK155_09250 [Bacteroidales bacterium]|nr:hypothetical protein [Bacteroidales bacterium]
MNKAVYVLGCLILSVNAWDLKIFESVVNNTTTPVLAVFWMAAGWLFFGNARKNGGLNMLRYNRYFYWLSLGFALSFVTAYVFWSQDIVTSFIVNRRLIFFLFIPVFFRIQPTERDIIKALDYFTVMYMIVWLWQAVSPAPITTSREIAIEAGRASFSMDKNDFGYLMPGYTLLLIPLYYRVQKFTENVSLRNFLPVMLMTGILFLLQNRGTLFFAVIVLVYAIFRIQSRYRYIFIIILGLLIIGAYLSTEKYWASFVDETSAQLSDPEYNRWKSLYYFIFQYSPHWLCYLMGNGYLSSHLDSGQFLMALMNSGFYQADLGIIGFWSMYGVIPILVIYAVVFKLLFYLPAPFYLKALSAHVLLVPICWGFSYYDMFLLILMSYLMGYYSEVFKPRPALKYSAVR